MSIKLAILGAVALTTGAAQARTPAVTVHPARAEPAAKQVEKQYCVRTTMSGSRIPQKVCRTRKAWLASGFDPLAPND